MTRFYFLMAMVLLLGCSKEQEVFPVDSEWAEKAALNSRPDEGDWVTVKFPSGEGTINGGFDGKEFRLELKYDDGREYVLSNTPEPMKIPEAKP